MANKKSTTSFHSELSKIGGGTFSGTQRENFLKGFTPSGGISFGKPTGKPSASTTSSKGTDWLGMAKKAAEGGAASLFTNSGAGSLMSGMGIFSLVSNIASLFGGHKAEPPALKLFQLPDAINQTVHTQSQTASTGSSSAVHVHVQAMDSQSFMNRSNDIARAVKTAMLNSHSLNDVVAEL
jgi:hypothetical protein